MANARTAVVTGGGGGLGQAIARGLGTAGFAVVVADLSREASERACADLRARGIRCMAVQCDVAEEDDVDAMTRAVLAELGSLDVLVNNAGIGPLRPFLEFPADTWRKVLEVNLFGVFLCGQKVARAMVRSGGGRIVNIASVSGVRAGFGRSAYGTSKAAVIHLTRQMAVELAPFGIAVNAVAPGPVDTELAQRHHTPQMRADYHAMIPMARYGTPEEIADAVTFLCSDKAAYISGQTLCVDGGFVAAGIGVTIAREAALPA